MKHPKKIVAALAVVAVLSLFACGVLSGGKEGVTYLTEAVRIGSIEQKVNATGEVSALQLVNVGAQVSGQIKKLHVSLGQEVALGDLIAEIDSVTQENDLQINKAKLESLEAQLAARQVALETARKQHDREKALKTRDATSTERLENAANALASAEAEVADMRSQVEQARIALSTAEVNLGYTRIVSPLAGTVVSVPVEEGQTVNAAQTTPTIVQIADLGNMEIKIQISEGDVTRVRPGMPVSYTILSEPGQVHSGVLGSIDPGLTTLSDGTYDGTAGSDSAVYYYGKLVVPNEHGRLRIGMTTQSVIAVNTARDVLMIPNMAVRRQGREYSVLVLTADGRAEPRLIEIGLADSLHTEVVSGLGENERVIVSSMTETEQTAAQTSTPRRGPRF